MIGGGLQTKLSLQLPDMATLRAMRAASPALQEWWPEGKKYDSDGDMIHDGESARSWHGVTWSDDRVQVLNLRDSKLEVLSPAIGQLQALTNLDLRGCPLKELPPQIGQLRALTSLFIGGCEQLTLAPGAEEGQPAQTIVAAYARLLIV